ncbi:helix-turn-helix domain-containing protein [Candidatus Nomurabacteria bacterium]|nr:helix-turn-helix domain-containing protein [Candidatus Nomurabacteria bacterium]
MDVITIQTEAFQQIINSIGDIKKLLGEKINKNPLKDLWLDISEVCLLLKVSKRTLQSYRDNGILAYSQIGGKIYFRASDIQDHLEKHYNKTFNPGR